MQRVLHSIVLRSIVLLLYCMASSIAPDTTGLWLTAQYGAAAWWTIPKLTPPGFVALFGVGDECQAVLRWCTIIYEVGIS